MRCRLLTLFSCLSVTVYLIKRAQKYCFFLRYANFPLFIKILRFFGGSGSSSPHYSLHINKLYIVYHSCYTHFPIVHFHIYCFATLRIYISRRGRTRQSPINPDKSGCKHRSQASVCTTCAPRQRINTKILY